ncbi:DUF6350 family protein [Streptomyces purpureus]|uniref:cell division protein PerM n=1 Tax=Streptomyces purpureus TaxID=1951 RepID=UPI0037967CE3
MSQVTEQSPPLSPNPVVQGGRSAALAVSFVRGAIAAGLGLGALAVVATVLWISSPYPDSGPGEALRAAAALWLLAHGVTLVRADTLSGAPTPLGIVPLLLLALPVWLAHRAARDSLDPGEGRPRPPTGGALLAVSGGYLLVAAAAVAYAMGGALTPDLPAAALRLPLVTLAAAATGVWTAHGRPQGPLPGRIPHRLRVGLARSWMTAAVRGAGTALATLVVGGALLVAVSLVWHASGTRASFDSLAADWPGRVAVALLCLVLLPNAAIWAAAYGLGPGFALGTGAVATPLGLTGTPALPVFPLLAAAPGPGPDGWAHWAAVGIPVAAGLVLARRTAAAPARKLRETALAALLGAVLCGAATSLAAALAGGPLGRQNLASLGPVWWQTGAAATVWTLAVGLPCALCVHAWRRRGLRRRLAVPTPVPAPAPSPGAPPVPPYAPTCSLPPYARAYAAPFAAPFAGLGEEKLTAEELDPAFEPYDCLPAQWEAPPEPSEPPQAGLPANAPQFPAPPEPPEPPEPPQAGPPANAPEFPPPPEEPPQKPPETREPPELP